jgi:hypothetical protein
LSLNPQLPADFQVDPDTSARLSGHAACHQLNTRRKAYEAALGISAESRQKAKQVLPMGS